MSTINNTTLSTKMLIFCKNINIRTKNNLFTNIQFNDTQKKNCYRLLAYCFRINISDDRLQLIS